jgi:hypothetical protein
MCRHIKEGNSATLLLSCAGLRYTLYQRSFVAWLWNAYDRKLKFCFHLLQTWILHTDYEAQMCWELGPLKPPGKTRVFECCGAMGVPLKFRSNESLGWTFESSDWKLAFSSELFSTVVFVPVNRLSLIFLKRVKYVLLGGEVSWRFLCYCPSWNRNVAV